MPRDLRPFTLKVIVLKATNLYRPKDKICELKSSGLGLLPGKHEASELQGSG